MGSTEVEVGKEGQTEKEIQEEDLPCSFVNNLPVDVSYIATNDTPLAVTTIFGRNHHLSFTF